MNWRTENIFGRENLKKKKNSEYVGFRERPWVEVTSILEEHMQQKYGPEIWK